MTLSQRVRAVLPIAAGYAGIAIVVWQATDVGVRALGASEVLVTLVVSASIAFFPVVCGWAYWRARPAAPTSTIIGAGGANRLVVLPLLNYSTTPNEDYFAEGLTDELTAVLSRLPGLQVIARTSAAQFGKRDHSIADIGRALRVGAVLDGSVRRAGQRLRISTQLIDVNTEACMWSEDYDRELRDIFEIQSDIARAVAAGLKLRLLTEDRAQLERKPTTDLRAFDLYLLGRHQVNTRTAEGTNRAIAYLTQAIEQDATYAEAYAALAGAHALASIGYSDRPTHESVSLGRRAVEQALRLNPKLPEAHAASGFLQLYWSDGSRANARASFERALELDGNSVTAHQWFAQYWIAMKQYERAAEQIDCAVNLDPLSPVLLMESSWPRLYAGQPAEARVLLEAALKLAPGYPMALYNMGGVLEMEGRFDEALSWHERALEGLPGSPFVLGDLAHCLLRAGRHEDGLRVLRELEARAAIAPNACVHIAYVYDLLRNPDLVVDWLNRALAEGDVMLCIVDTHYRAFPNTRDDPRFKAIQTRLGFPLHDWSQTPVHA